MKTIFRVLTLGFMMSAVPALSVFAQDAQDVCKDIDTNVALYKQFTDNFADKTIEKRQIAIDAGKQYIEKYASCPDYATQLDYLKKTVPSMEAEIAKVKKQQGTQALITRFNTAVKGSKTADILASGKEILAGEPDFLDVTITLASAGFDQAIANPPVDTYNNETINYSKQAIQQLEANKESKTKVYGVDQYSYKTDKFGGKENALGLMNYNIGYIMYYRQGKDNLAKKKEALPYLYKSTQYNAFSKTDPFVYQTIGAWYLDEAIRIDADRTAKIKAAGNKDTDETIAQLGVVKGYVNRSIDAYARAYKLAGAPGGDPKRKDALYAKLKELYAFRYDGKTEGIDAFVATVMNNPMPDPMTEVTPVVEAAPATTTTTSGTGTSSAMTSDTTSENTASMAKPAAVKTAGTTTTKAATAGAATTKTAAKKPAPKKKGTR
jgi:hypothetical protein